MKRIIIFLTASLLLLSACSSATLEGAGKELEDTIANAVNADNKYVQMVKGGYRAEEDSNLTYEDAFSAFFATPRWNYFKGEDGQNVVEYTGDCIYRDVTVKARIQFVVDEENETFEAIYLAFNEIPQDTLTLTTVISKAFEEADAIENKNTDNSSSADSVVRFKGISLDDIFHVPCTNLVEMFGEPDVWADTVEYEDDDLTFYLDSIDYLYIDSFSSWHPEDFEYKGHTFDGTLGELEELLGDYEALGAGGYQWVIGDYCLMFYIPKDTYRSECVDVVKFDAGPEEGDGPAYSDIYDIDYALIGRWRSYSTNKSITLDEIGQVTINWRVWDYINDTPDRCLWTASNGRLQIDAIFESTMPYSIRTEDPYGLGAKEYFYWGNEDMYAFMREDTGTNALPGDWKPNPNLIAGEMTLYENGTGYRGGKYFRWYADDTTYTEIQTQGRTYDYSVSGDTLTLFFSDGAEIFAKVGN